MSLTPWRVGGAQRQGRRHVQADGFVIGGHPASGRIAVCVTDGIGDTVQAREAAELVAHEAATAMLTGTPETGCMSARERLAASDLTTDASIITALFDPDHSRIQIAWAGLCRAYALTTDDQLQRATYDHSLGERIRRHTHRRGALPQYDRKVSRTAARHEFVTTSLPTHAVRAVLLCTDGISQVLVDSAIRRALMEPGPDQAAQLLANAVGIDNADNATAVVLRRDDD
ncbi:PP2C family protein-serine/threonine phosphatase [Streptomyces chartreusis]|uniref:PP2C family protein-serine/threonine phosphatase n=1 Tax=Streptomyces chartreusis TaxID=1969 RepID=UPI0035DD6E54